MEKQQQQAHFGLLSTISPEYDSAASAPSVGQGEIINYCGSTSSLTGQEDQLSNKKEEFPTSSFSGHHFTSTDRQLFSQAVMNFCSQDLLKWEIVEGEGFQNLVETLIFIGRRSSTGISSSTTIKHFDPIKRQLIQTGNQMKKIFLSQEKAISQSTKNDLEQIKNVGISLNCHQIEFGGEKQLIISINYITDDWRITQRILNEINWQIICELETFLEPFYETSQIFLDLNKPHFHKTALNPRLRHLPLICSDSERLSVYEKIRGMANLDKKPKESIKREEEHQQQPFCKRRRFLDQLEGCSLQEVKEEDELDCYLKATFTSSQTRNQLQHIKGSNRLNKGSPTVGSPGTVRGPPPVLPSPSPCDILEFWSSIGEEQFPRLAKLARFLLGISVAPLPLINKKGGINSGLNSDEIGILLNLRPNILNSVVNHQLSRYKIQQQQ
uniref:HAT C-terminal dimerisation domain-containing protein n=1 Tax=Meloidogyne javanica TaxID=6303 RepID=A0A915MHM5_MELJA